jgi:hypothetical protein
LKSEHLASFLSDDPWDDADLEQILVDLKGWFCCLLCDGCMRKTFAQSLHVL